MEFIIDKKTKSGRLILTDDLTIGRIREIRDEMEEALGKVKNLIVDVQKATQIDLTFLQLLCSAHRSAVGKHKTLTISGRINPSVKNALKENHYAREKGCVPGNTDICLWMVSEDE